MSEHHTKYSVMDRHVCYPSRGLTQKIDYFDVDEHRLIGDNPTLRIKGATEGKLFIENIGTGSGNALEVDTTTGQVIDSVSIAKHKQNIESTALAEDLEQKILDAMDFYTFEFKSQPGRPNFGLVIDYLRDNLADDPDTLEWVDKYLINFDSEDNPRGFDQIGLTMLLFSVVKKLRAGTL